MGWFSFKTIFNPAGALYEANMESSRKAAEAATAQAKAQEDQYNLSLQEAQQAAAKAANDAAIADSSASNTTNYTQTDTAGTADALNLTRKKAKSSNISVGL